jgi:hypothetical protein
VHDPAAPSLTARDLHCANRDLVYSLMYGTYSTDSGKTFVAEVNFNSNKITYTRYLQSASGGAVYHGVIVAANKFYIGGYVSTIYKAASTSFSTRSPGYDHGVIFSPSHTCQ